MKKIPYLDMVKELLDTEEFLQFQKTYNIPIIIHLPLQYPNTPAYFYIHKRPRTGINKAYYEQEKIIDPNTFRINTDRICPFNPSRNNLDEIINEMKKRFVNSFPIYAEKQNTNTQPIPPGPNNPDQRKTNQVIVESSKMTNKQAIEMLRKQTRDIVIKKYHEFNNKYKVRENRGELATISNIVKLKSGNSGNGNQNPMNDSLNLDNLSVSGMASMKIAKGWKPYFGLGWDIRLFYQFYLTIDLGVMYTGKWEAPSISIDYSKTKDRISQAVQGKANDVIADAGATTVDYNSIKSKFKFIEH